MTPTDIKSWLEVGASAISAFREGIKLLPSGGKKDEAEKAILRFEEEFKRSEAKLAVDLGYELCHRCWPPEIMLLSDQDILTCRKCGKPWHKGYESVPRPPQTPLI